MNLPILEKREILAALSGASAQNNLWRAILSVQHDIKQNAIQAALMPNLPDSVRAYNNGYAAQANDTLAALQDLWDEAQKLNRDEQPNQQPS